MANDISNNVVMVLLVLVVVVSAFGTWALLEGSSGAQFSNPSDASGQVNLEISELPGPQTSVGQASVQLQIQDTEES